MTWLTLWLKKIILLVLLAAFLDLILPNTTLQRYVKMVMGLILLLTIISPLFSLFNLSQDDLALRLDRYQEELNKPGDNEWKRITSKLLSHQSEQTTAYVQSQISAAVKTRVKDVYGMDVQHIEIQMDKSNPDQPVLQRIALIVGDSGSKEQASDQAFVQPIQPIQPVDIQISTPAVKTDRAPPDREVSARESNPTHARIASDVALQWGLATDQVSVTDESRSSEKQ